MVFFYMGGGCNWADGVYRNFVARGGAKEAQRQFTDYMGLKKSNQGPPPIAPRSGNGGISSSQRTPLELRGLCGNNAVEGNLKRKELPATFGDENGHGKGIAPPAGGHRFSQRRAFFFYSFLFSSMGIKLGESERFLSTPQCRKART